MKNNELIPKKDNIITRLREKLYNLFHHNNHEQEDETQNGVGDASQKYTGEKKRILEMYEQLKKRQISVYDIPRHDLRFLKEIMLKEIELKEKKLNEMQTEINMSINNINYYSEEIEKYKKKTSEY